ncbi:MAG TPA: hypothetical protein VFL95_07645, partial [Gemmatimonadales bacterium]|nr:hypothetical protein [Gemmatimonadales bacterium]
MSPRIWLAAVVVLFLRPLPPAPHDWITEHPTLAHRLAVLPDTLHESSGVAASHLEPGLFWTLNDSGNLPVVFAVDRAGRLRRAFRAKGAGNNDWEAVSVGPCGNESCVYIGDIGDNRRARPSIILFRVREQDALRALVRSDSTPIIPAQALTVKYPDGPKDAESLVVLPNGDALIIAKPLRIAAVPYYLVPAAAWDSGSVEAQGRGTLPIDPRTGPAGWVTDAAVAPDGRRVVVRSYRSLFFFQLTHDNHLTAGDPPRRCDVSGLEPQGEGVTWADDSTFVLTTERLFTGPATLDEV